MSVYPIIDTHELTWIKQTLLHLFVQFIDTTLKSLNQAINTIFKRIHTEHVFT